MVTTLIEYKNNNLIRFNPIDLGHSSIYQEFKTKLFTKNTSNTHGNEFIYTTTEFINCTTKNVQGNLKRGYYYPYITFTPNGKFNKVVLIPQKERPLNSKYYTRINKLIYIQTNKTFEPFDNIVLINNMPNDTYMLNYINSVEQKLTPVDNTKVYSYTVDWSGNTTFNVTKNTGNHITKIIKDSNNKLDVYFNDNFLEDSDIINVNLSSNNPHRATNYIATSTVSQEIISTLYINNDYPNNHLNIQAIDNSGSYLTLLNDIGSFHNRCDIIIRKKY